MFFFKQKTAYEMRISDWSSDVCSSDLAGGAIGPAQNVTDGFDQAPGRPQPHHRAEPQQIASARGQHAFYRTTQRIGHARGYIRKDGADTRPAVLCPPENRRDGRPDTAEGKKRHPRKIGQVARMHEKGTTKWRGRVG